MSKPIEIGQSFRGPDGPVSFLLRQAHSAFRGAIDRELAPLGLTGPQYSALNVIARLPGLSGSELARASMLTQQTVNEILLTLEGRRWITRQPRDGNRRILEVQATEEGRRTIRRARRVVSKIERRMVASLDVGEEKLFREWLVACARGLATRRRATGLPLSAKCDREWSYSNAMSKENVELHHQAVDAFNRRDLDAFLALTDTEVETAPRLASVEGSFHGHDGVARWWQNLLDAFPDFTAEIVEVHDLGDLTLATVRTTGHGAGSETPLDQTMWQVVRWRRGKCIWRGTFETRAEALEAAGLSEQGAHADSP